MTFNENWTKWFYGSVQKHFTDGLSTYSLFWIGEKFSEDAVPRIQGKIIGPHFKEDSNGVWEVIIEVTFFLTFSRTLSDVSAIHLAAGKIQALYTDINVKKYGPLVGDDESLLCKLRKPHSAPVSWTYVGVVDNEDDNVVSGVVGGRYHINL